jgi:hypothetical protein
MNTTQAGGIELRRKGWGDKRRFEEAHHGITISYPTDGRTVAAWGVG